PLDSSNPLSPLPSFPTRRSSDLQFRKRPVPLEMAASLPASHHRELRQTDATHRHALRSAPGRSGTFGRSLALSQSRHEDAAPRLDRKSTRLNSSHDQISYAVFCL